MKLLPNGFYIYDHYDCWIVGDIGFWKGTNFDVYAQVLKTKNPTEDKKKLREQFYENNPEYIKND